MDFLQRFMMGRYGSDQLSLALLVFSVALSLIARFLDVPALSALSYVPLGLALFRMLSKNLQKRRRENDRFRTLTGPAAAWFSKTRRRLSDFSTHKYLKCRSCGAALRLPRGKGRLSVRCPRCGAEFEEKT